VIGYEGGELEVVEVVQVDFEINASEGNESMIVGEVDEAGGMDDVGAEEETIKVLDGEILGGCGDIEESEFTL
jgi:hypothetical protein